MESVIYPAHIRLVVRNASGWYFLKGEPFANLYNFPTLAQADLFSLFGLTMKEVANELRKINNATHGFYLANLQERKYYYCGPLWDDLREKLIEIGIGVGDK